ncbi:putative clathrin assembly protein At5g35200 [Salvia miltiorrhiza]|uniref:putative clathrin assembly protein At5g35200 n=1 Tax=Salvia miltiorrhiza TaxID=226208 RepID=UPI0025AC8B93|nr:putative clathrin assembly protein At5g35200 [Salvia miltiorrhiza]XP_057767236.1 putative clathrin assembly protein At5g35200 [Salvia miltiorrhiza]
MAAGTNSQQSFRNAIKSIIKESTSVNSQYKHIKVTIIKATNHLESLPKEKHVRTLLAAVSGSRPRADVGYCIHALKMRLAQADSWVVALKILIVVHRALREVDRSFLEELSFHSKHRRHMFNLLHFKDKTSPSTMDYSAWIRTYALYIEECLQCFRVLKYDFYSDPTRTKNLDIPALLEQLPALQQLLLRLLCCQPIGAATYNYMVQFTLSMVAAESVKLYVAITDGVLILVDKFFEMQRGDAVAAHAIYRRAVEQAQRLSDFFEMCRSLEFDQTQKYVKIEQPPASFLTAMEEYIRDAPQTIILPWTSNDDGRVAPKLIAIPDPKQAASEEGSHSSDECEEEAATKADKRDKAAPPPLIPDLLSWDEPSEEAPESMAAPEGSSNATGDSHVSTDATGWELALATPPPCGSAPFTLCKGGVVDRSVLDSLYETALTKPPPSANGAPSQTPKASSSANPFEADDHVHDPNIFYSGYNHNMFLYPNPSPAAQQSFMQPPPFMQQHHMVVHDYMQTAGAAVPQQLQEFAKQNYHQQRYLQIAGIHHQPPPLAQQNYLQGQVPVPPPPQQQKPIVGHFSNISFGNPFMEQSSLPVVAQNRSSSFNLL